MDGAVGSAEAARPWVERRAARAIMAAVLAVWLEDRLQRVALPLRDADAGQALLCIRLGQALGVRWRCLMRLPEDVGAIMDRFLLI